MSFGSGAILPMELKRISEVHFQNLKKSIYTSLLDICGALVFRCLSIQPFSACPLPPSILPPLTTSLFVSSTLPAGLLTTKAANWRGSLGKQHKCNHVSSLSLFWFRRSNNSNRRPSAHWLITTTTATPLRPQDDNDEGIDKYHTVLDILHTTSGWELSVSDQVNRVRERYMLSFRGMRGTMVGSLPEGSPFVYRPPRFRFQLIDTMLHWDIDIVAAVMAMVM